MSLELNNIVSLMALRSVRLQQAKVAQATARLASGERLNHAADDPAGLIASASMHASLAALDAESQTNERALVVTSIADGALGQISDLLDQAKGLVAANANTSGLSAEERSANQVEIDAILSSVDRLASDTKFGGKPLLDGSATISASGNSLTLASGKSDQLGNTTVDGATHTLADLRSGGSLDITSSDATTSMAVISAAIGNVATLRGKAGAFMKNDVEPRLSQIASARGHLISTVSMIQDADIANEVSAAARAELLSSSSQQALGYELMKSMQSRSLMQSTHVDVRA
jgi:flagellin